MAAFSPWICFLLTVAGPKAARYNVHLEGMGNEQIHR